MHLFLNLITKSSILKVFSRSIRITPFNMDEAMNNLEKNPYFKKYENRIHEFQKTSPSEFLSRVDKATEKKKSEPGGHGFSKVSDKGKSSLPSTAYAFAPQKKLDSIMKVDLLRSKNSKDIKYIWTEYFMKKDAISGTLTLEHFEKIQNLATKYPMFLFPLPRSEGYEFIISQFAANEIHFTPLINYQTYQENAPECLTIVHYPDLAQEKGIVLMHGDFNKDILNAKEAQFLVNQLHLYYGGDDEKKLDLLEKFHQCPNSFKHMDLIEELETINLGSLSNKKTS